MKNRVLKIFRIVMLSLILLRGIASLSLCFAAVEETESAIEKAEKLLSENVFERIKNSLTQELVKSFKSFTKVFAAMLFVTFMLGLMNAASSGNTALYCGEICLCTFAFSVVSAVTENISGILGALQSFMMSALPVMTALYSSSFAPASAALSYGSTILALNVCNVLITSLIVPCVKCITFLAVMTYISKSFDFSGISTFVKNTSGWIFGIIMCIMSSVIAMQSIIAASKDGVMVKTVRFAASRFIPIIGGTVSESARTIAESLKLVRGVTGISGIFVIAGIVASPVIALLVCRFFLNMCCALARMFSLPKTALFFTELSGVMNLMLGACVGIFLILVLILGIFAKANISV